MYINNKGRSFREAAFMLNHGQLLVDEALKGLITFRHAGLSPVDENGKANMLSDQLLHFYQSLLLHGMKKSHRPASWLEAFFMLEQWLQGIDNIMVVVCGSATSWIQDNLINNHGGLYGRVTREIKLSPFTLKESELFFKNKGVHLSRYDIVQCNMVFGGIPYYLQYFTKLSNLRIISSICAK